MATYWAAGPAAPPALLTPAAIVHRDRALRLYITIVVKSSVINADGTVRWSLKSQASPIAPITLTARPSKSRDTSAASRSFCARVLSSSEA